MAVARVILNNDTLVDMTDATATSGSIVTGSTAYIADGSKASGSYSPSLQTKTKSYTPTETAQSETVTADGGYDGLSSVSVSVGAISSTYVGSGITQRSSSDLTASGATVTVPSGYYASQTSKAVSSGSATAPASISGTSATVSTGTNTITLSKSVSVTPTVSAGFVASGTAGNSSVSLTASVTTKDAQTYTPTTTTQTISAGQYLTGAQTIGAIPSQYIIPSGNLAISANGSGIDVSQYATVSVNVSSSVTIATKTATASNYPVSLEFTNLSGQPKMFVCRLNASVSSSGSTTYYYIVDFAMTGNGTAHGNCFRVGSTRQVTSISSGYTWSYSGTTLTLTSSAASRSASPGAFYSGSYELIYAY